MYGMGGYGPMGGYGGGGPQFQNAVGQHLGNMMGGGAAHGMGNQMGYAPGGMPQPNPNYGQMPAPAPRPMPMPYSVDFSRLLGGGMSQYPGFGGAVQPGGMDYLRGQFGGGYGGGSPWGAPVDNDSGYGRPTYGGAPSPDGGAVHNDQRQYANGDQYHNRKGNLRMRYRNMQPSYQ